MTSTKPTSARSRRASRHLLRGCLSRPEVPGAHPRAALWLRGRAGRGHLQGGSVDRQFRALVAARNDRNGRDHRAAGDQGVDGSQCCASIFSPHQAVFGAEYRPAPQARNPPGTPAVPTGEPTRGGRTKPQGVGPEEWCAVLPSRWWWGCPTANAQRSSRATSRRGKA